MFPGGFEDRTYGRWAIWIPEEDRIYGRLAIWILAEDRIYGKWANWILELKDKLSRL